MELAGYVLIWLVCYIATLATAAKMRWKVLFNFMLALGFIPIGVLVLEAIFGTTGWFGALIMFSVAMVSIVIAVPVVIYGIYEAMKETAGVPNGS